MPQFQNSLGIHAGAACLIGYLTSIPDVDWWPAAQRGNASATSYTIMTDRELFYIGLSRCDIPQVFEPTSQRTMPMVVIISPTELPQALGCGWPAQD